MPKSKGNMFFDSISKNRAVINEYIGLKKISTTEKRKIDNNKFKEFIIKNRNDNCKKLEMR